MTDRVERYLVENHGPQKAAAKWALDEGRRLCGEYSTTRLTLMVSQKGNFDSTVVGRLIGRAGCKILCAGREVAVDQSLAIALTTTQLHQDYGDYGVLLGLYLSGRSLNKLDSSKKAAAIILLPWTEEVGREWQSTWAPQVLGESTWNANPPTLDSVVIDKLSFLTACVNLTTGIVHPSDKKHAQDTFKELRRLGHDVDGTEVVKWAKVNGWEPGDADALGKLCDRIMK